MHTVKNLHITEGPVIKMSEASVDWATVGKVQPSGQVYVAGHPEGVKSVLSSLCFYCSWRNLNTRICKLNQKKFYCKQVFIRT